MAGRVGWPRGKIIRDVIRTNFSDTLQYKTRIGRCAQLSQATAGLARHVSTEPKTDAAGPLPSTAAGSKCNSVFRSFGDDLAAGCHRGFREFSTKNKIKRLATKSAKQRPESKSSLRKIEKGKSSHSVTTDIAGKFKKIHKKTTTGTSAAAGATSERVGLSGGTGGYLASGNRQPAYSSGNNNGEHRPSGSAGKPIHHHHKDQSRFITSNSNRQTAGARMHELRQVQRHHDPVRYLGKSHEAEYIPRPVTKYRSFAKAQGSSMDNPVVAPISTFTKPKKQSAAMSGSGGGVIHPGSNSRFDSRNKLLRDGRIPLSKKQRSNPQLGHLPFDPHDVVNRSIKYPIPEEISRPRRESRAKQLQQQQQQHHTAHLVSTTTMTKKTPIKEDVIKRTARHATSPGRQRGGTTSRGDDILGPIRAEYLEPPIRNNSNQPPRHDRSGLTQQQQQQMKSRPKRRQSLIQETFVHDHHNMPSLHPKVVLKNFIPPNKHSTSKLQTKIPDYGQNKRSLTIDEWSTDPVPVGQSGSKPPPGSDLPKMPNTLDLRSSGGETSFGINPTAQTNGKTLTKPLTKRANLKSKRASQLGHHQTHYQSEQSTLPAFQYPRPPSRKLSRSLFRTVDTTYLKMTSPKPPEKKPWAQPEVFVPLDIPRPRQNWDSKRLKELASVKRNATTSAWTMSKNRAMKQTGEKYKTGIVNPHHLPSLPQTMVQQQQSSSIVKKLKVREPIEKNSNVSYGTSETVSEDSIKGSAMEQRTAILQQLRTKQQQQHPSPQTPRGLNLDSISSYKTRAPYPSFAESFKMMPRPKQSSGSRHQNMQMYDYSTSSSTPENRSNIPRQGRHYSDWKK